MQVFYDPEEFLEVLEGKKDHSVLMKGYYFIISFFHFIIIFFLILQGGNLVGSGCPMFGEKKLEVTENAITRAPVEEKKTKKKGCLG